MRPIRLTLMFVVAGAVLALPVGARAANWLVVASDAGERIEIDLARIARVADGKTTAWNRLVLGHEVRNANHGNYSAVQALNQYDCQHRRFATVKRVYLLGEKTVGEESVPTPREIGVVRGGIDDRLLTEACRLRTVGEMKQIADAAGKVAAADQEAAATEQPKPMHADMRSAGDKAKNPVATAADSATSADVAEQAGGSTADKSAAPLLPKRLIELPKIDRSQVERPKEAVTAKPVDKPKAGSGRSATEREKQYATSGPRRAAKKKPVVEHNHSETAPVTASSGARWGYAGEGGPGAWGRLRPEYATCGSGKRQSPIDIRDAIHVDLEPIAFDYRETRFRIVDTGHTVQVNVGEGSSITVMGRQYQLERIDFHHPAEERIEGRGFDMVAHLIHKDVENHVAIVSVLIEKGSEHPVIQTLWNNLPLEVDQELAPKELIDLNRLLPENRAYMTYMGSLTTPPCSEGVLWMVFRQPIPISAEQMTIFARVYPNNARPLQPANGRLIKESR
jgi:carbonic anhydrase